MSSFDYDDPKYRCCCGKCEAKQGAFILSVVELVLGILGLIGGGISVAGNAYVSSNLLSAIVMIVAGVLGIVGIKKNMKVLLLVDYIIHLVLVVLAIIGVVIAVVALVVVLISDAPRHGEAKGVLVGGAIGLVVVTLIALLIDVWFMLIIRGAYHFMRDEEAAAGAGRGRVAGGAYAHGTGGTPAGYQTSQPGYGTN